MNLSIEQETQLRQWARKTLDPKNGPRGMDPLWHQVIREEYINMIEEYGW